jgi:hypothetical protein
MLTLVILMLQTANFKSWRMMHLLTIYRNFEVSNVMLKI